MQELLTQFDSFWAFLGLILGFSFLIFIHELGHHLVAKWVGIKVTQFAIGFGPSMAAWRKGIGFKAGSTEPELHRRLKKYLKDNAADGDDDEIDLEKVSPAKIDEATAALGLGETEYRLNWIPLGGYVKMLGQEDLNPDASQCQDERSFNAKPIWARACVVSAGVVMNLFFGVVFFIAAFMIGVEFPPAIVGSVQPDSPASQTYAQGHENDAAYQGLRTGDHITRINDNDVTDFADVAIETALASPGEVLRLVVERDGQPRPLTYPITPREDPNTKLLALGVGRPMSLELQKPPKGKSLPPVLADAGVRPGMVVESIVGTPVKHYDQFEQAVAAGQGQPVPVRFVDPANNQTVEVQLSALPGLFSQGEDEPANVIGLVPPIKLSGVVKGSPADKGGLVKGDILAQVGPTAWPTWNDVVDHVQQAQGGPIRIAVLREGKTVELKPIHPRYNGTIGILYGLALDQTLVARTLPDSPAATLRLNAGSSILSIDGQPVTDFGEIQRLLAAAVKADFEKNQSAQPPTADAPATTVTIGYQTNIANAPPAQAVIQIDTATAAQLADAQWHQPLGMSVFKMLLIPLKAHNPVRAAELGIKKAHQVMLQTYLTLLRLFQGTVKPSHLRGPLGIADDGTAFAKQGASYLMFFLGLISINLVVINFLPIPIVDGGLMVFLLIEKLKGSPVSVRIQTAATVLGLAMIGSVFLLTLFYDAKRLLGL